MSRKTPPSVRNCSCASRWWASCPTTFRALPPLRARPATWIPRTAQCYASSAGSCGGFAGLATYWAAYDTMAKAVELLPADSEYMEHAKSSLGKFRSVFPSSEECFFNELQEGARYTVTCGTAAGITTTVRAR